ncbi:hypothetical protein OSCT_0768 [Oscillochloris trichoides DG-6]|uniref:Pectinesterase catalytic domain-containing protein n=1 Tax=Oscillochloris trichoides DG-6 TaxID=765420 RepID=E1IBR7_9CHLR|nr:pectinesterase family protein [Oscillochloris trichoides]EFO81369.1 hypothetical protein OSCT_0768 [Oscillochloris trichoides DG-6]
MRRLTPHLFTVLVTLLLVGVGQVFARPQPNATPTALPTAFTYQGQLMDAGQPANGSYDLTFRLYDAVSAGTQIGSAVALSGVAVSQGIFTVQLDFGSGAFTDARFLEIQVGTTILSPRQPITPAPAALYAASVPWSGVTGVPAGLSDGDNDTTYSAGVGMALSGTTFRAEGSPYAQVIVVAQSGGDFTRIQAALDSITDASASKPYLVYVAPGVYTERVTMKAYVTIEGAGQGATIIRGTGGGGGELNSATVLGASNATLRHLSIESDGSDGKTFAVGIYNDSSSPTINDVTITAYGGIVNYSILNVSSAPTISHVITTTSGGTTTYGIYNYSSTPTISHVTITTSGETGSIGIYNSSSDPTISYVTIVASGGTTNSGFHNVSSSPTISNVRVTASGGTTTYGIFNTSGSAPTISNTTLSASGGTYNHGISNNTSSPTIRDSAISGSTYSIYNDGSTTKVAYSMLNGPRSSGTTCIGTYDANFAAVTCP